MTNMLNKFSKFELKTELEAIKKYLNNSFLINDVMNRIEILLYKAKFQDPNDAEKIYNALYPIVESILNCGALPYRLERNLSNFSVEILKFGKLDIIKSILFSTCSGAEVTFYKSGKCCLKYYNNWEYLLKEREISVGPIIMCLSSPNAVRQEVNKLAIPHELLHLSSVFCSSEKLLNGFSEKNSSFSFLEFFTSKLAIELFCDNEFSEFLKNFPINHFLVYSLLTRINKNEFLRTYYMGDEEQFTCLLKSTSSEDYNNLKKLLNNAIVPIEINNIIEKYNLQDDQHIKTFHR